LTTSATRLADPAVPARTRLPRWSSRRGDDGALFDREDAALQVHEPSPAKGRDAGDDRLGANRLREIPVELEGEGLDEVDDGKCPALVT
jgi:hypothetical protein